MLIPSILARMRQAFTRIMPDGAETPGPFAIAGEARQAGRAFVDIAVLAGVGVGFAEDFGAAVH
jgi:hypothetical protein